MIKTKSRARVGLHIKLTEHFLTKALQRGLQPIELALLWRLMVSGELGRLAATLEDHERGAVNVGRRWVVFRLDENDAGLVTFVTLLDGKVEHVMPKHATRPLRADGIYAVDVNELARISKADA